MREEPPMKLTAIANRQSLRPMKIPAREVPHAVLESNYTCNRQCVHCYNRFRGIVKPLDQLTEEVDQALAVRNLETISILGGEPTLHPHLTEIVRYIKSKGLICQILSNGVILAKPGGDRLLDQLIGAGLDRIVVHVDDGQGLNAEEVESMRATLFAKFEERHLYFGLSLTLSDESVKRVPEIMRGYSRYRYFDGILSTVAREMEEVVLSHSSTGGSPQLADVYASISDGLRIEPSSYLPSSLDDEEVRWLIYFYYLNAATGETVPISPAFTRLMRRAYRRLKGKHLFAAPLRTSLSKIWLLVTLLCEVPLHPSIFGRYVRLVRRSRFLREIRHQYIVVQSTPLFNAGKQEIEICYHCPDATIRNGRLAPVCLADWISPPGKERGANGHHPEVAETVYGHLEVA
jgi:hypothetical protein